MLCNGMLSMCLLTKRQLGIEVIMPMEKMIDITKRDIYERIRYGIMDSKGLFDIPINCRYCR